MKAIEDKIKQIKENRFFSGLNKDATLTILRRINRECDKDVCVKIKNAFIMECANCDEKLALANKEIIRIMGLIDQFAKDSDVDGRKIKYEFTRSDLRDLREQILNSKKQSFTPLTEQHFKAQKEIDKMIMNK